MTKIKILAISIILFFSTIQLSLADEQQVNFHIFDNNNDNLKKYSVTIPINIRNYEIKKTEIGDNINIAEFGQISKPGEPKIPVKIISLAIPKNAIPIKLSYKIKEKISIPGLYKIKPAPIVLLENQYQSKSIAIEEYNRNYQMIYSSNQNFPEEIISYERTSYYRDYKLIDIKIYPITYNPISEKLTFYSKINIIIDYDLDEENKEKTRTLNSIKSNNVAKEIIYNYNQTKEWYQTNYSNGLYDFIIITIDSLSDAVQPLIEWETQKGRNVNLITISWIESEYEGIDLAEKIRNFLRDKYLGSDWGIEDVLIVGHYDDIPLRKVWQGLSNMEKPETDFYYAELSLADNESWDSNQNQRYGDSFDEIDFFAEVNVGRIPWSDYETVLHICEKSVNFEQNSDPSFKNNILTLAARVDQQTDGAVYTEYILNSTINPWMNHWSKTRLYERDSIYPMDNVLNHLNVISTWSNGKYAFVAWHAHGSPEGSYVGNQAFIHVNDCTNLNDEFPSIISSASCSNSDTDYLNIGQAMLRQGAVGFLGANKAAYYCPGWTNPNDGSDQSFKYFFTSKVTSGELTQGEALQYSIREMYTRDLWNQLKYETFVHSSLWGNPDLGLKSLNENNPPLKPNTPDGPSNGKINTEYTYVCNTTDPDNDQIYYCWSWGDNEIEWIGPFNSGENAIATHTWEVEGSFEIKVKSKDIYGTESEWSNPIQISMPKRNQNMANDFPTFKNIIFNLFRFINNII